MSTGEVLSTVGTLLSSMSVVIAICVFVHNSRKDRRMELEKRDSSVKKEQAFYVETTLVLGELKADISDIKSQMKENVTANNNIEKRVIKLEERVNNIEKSLSGRN